MTAKELIEIESYLLDRKKPNYNLAQKVMNVLEDYTRLQAELDRLTKEGVS